MALPAGLATVTVTVGPYLTASGAPAGGRVTFTPEQPTTYGGAYIGDGAVTVRLGEDGTGSATLAAAGVPYVVNWSLTGLPSPRHRRILLPADTPTVDVDELLPVATPTGLLSVPAVTSIDGLTGPLTAGQVADVLEDLVARKDQAPILPVMVTYPERTRAAWRVLFHTGSTLYATMQNAAGTLAKSVDNGTTWTTLVGAVGFEPHVLLRSSQTGTLLVVGLTGTVRRSTDDGATWTTIAGVLNYPPLGPDGIAETPAGHLMLSEYGNVGNTVYRVRRSTDDGQTWATVLSSPGTDPANDPGHIHSVTYDKATGRYVAFMDRPVPDIYYSTDEGATWTRIPAPAPPSELHWPNFVAPMYFPNFIAWGYDNEANGTISRMTRADFYSGAWGDSAENVEVIARVTGKAFYEPFPIDDDTWIVCGASEHIGGTATGEIGAYAQEIYIVYADGSRVAGGLVHASPSVNTNTLLGQRARPAGRVFDEYDHDQKSWINLNTAGVPYQYASMPFTVAPAQVAPRAVMAASGPLIAHDEAGVWSRAEDGTLSQIFVANTNGRVSFKNPRNTSGPELRIYEGTVGIIAAAFGGTLVGSFVSDGRLQLTDGKYLEMGSTAGAPRVVSSTASPEGAVTAPPGSLCLARTGDHYRKATGTGNTGWVLSN